MIDDQVPPQLREAIDRQLEQSESIIWLEQPDPKRFKSAVAWSAFAIGALGTPDVLTQTYQWVTGNLLWRGSLPSLIAPALLCLLLACPLLARLMARNFAYVITDRRVLVARRGLSGIQLRSFAPEQLKIEISGRFFDKTNGNIDLVRSSDDDEMLCMQALRDVRATETALNSLIQSSSKSSL